MIDIQLLDKLLSVQACLDFVGDDSVGGTVLFIGTVRNKTQSRAVLHLIFEAYKPMAVAEMQKIANNIVTKWAAHKISIHHRVGHVSVGEIAVIIAIATPHRKAAFEACQFAIDTLKQTVPIWKKEVFEDGEVWVAAHP